jgi:peptide/nickel transport system substrate-binding protein
VNGEIDILEQPAFESYAPLKADKNIQVVNSNPLGFQYMGRFNHLHPPFDNPKVRQAALAAFQQEPFLRAQIGDKEIYRSCASMFTCGTPYGSAKGSDVQSKSSVKKAQELLKASGYDGTPVVLMKPTDLASIGKLPDVAAQLLRQAGFKVDLQAMDWNTLVGRRAKKDAPAAGGWNMFFTAWVAPDIWNPLTNPAVGALGEKSWFGWPSDPAMEKLRDDFARATDDAKKKALAEQIQARAFEIGTHAPLGEYINPLAARRNITGFVTGPATSTGTLRRTDRLHRPAAGGDDPGPRGRRGTGVPAAAADAGRSCGHPRRRRRDRRADREDPRRARPRPAAGGAVRHLDRQGAERRSRPVVLLPHRRRDAHRPAPRADLRASPP